MNLRFVGARTLTALAVGCVLGVAVAQPPQPKPPAAQDPEALEALEAALEAALARWLDSTHNSPELLVATVDAVLADQQRGIARVSELLATTEAQPHVPRSRGIRQLVTRVALTYLQRENESKVVYAGQYAALRPLQPFAGELFFSWLLDTPDWFPDTHRIQLVPALRDLQPTLPGPDKLEGVLAIVNNKDVEPESLRTALACMLWQWGKKEFVQPRLDALLRASTEGETDERAQALLDRAALQYDLRDYKASVATHRALQSLAAHSDFELKPVDWYSAACVHALCGQVERGIEALSRCAALQASADVDSSHKVEDEVFDIDPEIDALRKHERFAAIVAKAKKGRGAGEADPWKK